MRKKFEIKVVWFLESIIKNYRPPPSSFRSLFIFWKNDPIKNYRVHTNGDLGFGLDAHFVGHLKDNFCFSNRNPHLWSWILKEQKILCTGTVTPMNWKEWGLQPSKNISWFPNSRQSFEDFQWSLQVSKESVIWCFACLITYHPERNFTSTGHTYLNEKFYAFSESKVSGFHLKKNKMFQTTLKINVKVK